MSAMVEENYIQPMETLSQHTMPLSDFVECLERGDIPPLPPHGTTLDNPRNIAPLEYIMEGVRVRPEITHKYNFWAIVDQRWTKQLADWIGHKLVLEIMAGSGWLSKALTEHGIQMTATDNFSTHDTSQDNCVFQVENLEASQAVDRYKHQADVLLISWPPYDDDTGIVEACKKWPSDKPVIYIGEGRYGCNAGEEFWNYYHYEKLSVELHCWHGIHDRVFSGYFRPEKRLVFDD